MLEKDKRGAAEGNAPIFPPVSAVTGKLDYAAFSSPRRNSYRSI